MKRKQNKYDLTGEYGIGYTSSDKEFYFDLEDYEKIKDISWHINSDGYVHGVVNNNKKISLHRLIMGEPYGLDVDHIHGRNTRNDCRKENLRIGTDQQNKMNCPVRKDNTSGTTGVSWHKRKQKWIAQINVNGKLKYLGLYDNIESAIRARQEAEDKYYGSWSYRKSQEINNEVNKHESLDS